MTVDASRFGSADATTEAARQSGGGFRGRLRRAIETPVFERSVIAAIVLNAVILGLETYPTVMAHLGSWLHRVDDVLLVFFIGELALRMFAYGGRFFRDPWAMFDAAIVAVALFPASENVSVLRALRILRALRLISAIPSVRRVVGGLLAAVPSMGSIIGLLLLINYVFAVMATKLFGDRFVEHFGSLGASFFTFFQIMTLEGWSGEIVRPVMEVYPWAWVFFVPYIVLATFMVLNLFIGIVVDAMQQQTSEADEKIIDEVHVDAARVLQEVARLRAELRLVAEGKPLPHIEPN